MITDGLSKAFQSDRLVYRALENNEEDRRFLHSQIDNDPMNTALFDPRVIQPRTQKHVELLANTLTRSTLAVMVCLPPGTPLLDGNGFAGYERSIGFVVFGWGGTFPDQAHHRSITMSISLAATYQGKGYGTEAVNWALDWAFRFGGYHRVSLNTVSFNERAQHLYKRLGFTEEGRSRESHWHDRKWYDSVNFGMLEAEWAALRGLQ
ncbi:acyl-CoA N-acyltransferase [Ilyonectria destructans]|nr:acyl-CoA N-acyltransferase [Ilyonectria destructans]